MAGALPLVGQNEKGIAKSLSCPICFEFPKDKVFLCKKGHSLCRVCYQGCSECPLCRCPLDKDDPIRNFSLEEVLDNLLDVDCPYKVNGCGQRPKRGLIQAHQSKCHFNFEKFGKLINVCKLIGYEDCDFKLNNGITEDAVKHYVSAHGCVVVSTNHFQMELAGLQETTDAGFNNDCFWSPIISDLKNCFLLTFAILSRKDGLTCVSLIMPKLNETCQPLVMQYSFNVTTEGEEPLKYGVLRSCIDVRKVEWLLPNRLSCTFSLSSLKSHFTNGSLLIDCLLQDLKSCNETDKIKPERIVCFKRTASSNGILSGMEQKGTVSKAKGRKHRNKDVGISESSAGAAIAGEGVTGFRKAMSNGILVRNVPANTTLENIKKIFAKFGDVLGGVIQKQPLSAFLDPNRCNETSESWILIFVHPSAVEKVMQCKRRIFMKRNGKKHYLSVDSLEILPDGLPITTFTAATTFIDKAQTICTMNRDSFLACVVEAFAKTGEPTVLNHLKKTMSIMAAKDGSLESLKHCIDKGIDLNQPQSEPESFSCQSLLAYALADRDKKIGFEKAKLLVESGADIQQTQHFGNSFLHLSVLWGSDDAVKFFLDKGFDVNACNKEGWTPLHQALLLKQDVTFLTEKVKLLLDHGADVKIQDVKGRSAINYVKENLLSEEIQEMFRKHLEPTPTDSDATNEI